MQINADLKIYLDQLHDKYNNEAFIAHDPISLPHLFSKKQDIEIAGFFAAILAWGQRAVILRNARHLLQCMDMDPYHFIINHSAGDLKPFSKFVHRTFNGYDCLYFISALRNLYLQHKSLEEIFYAGFSAEKNMGAAISYFRKVFLQNETLGRSHKHIGDPAGNAAAKRINMFLRWMVRQDNNGVDFGLWKKLDPAFLLCPLDIHSGRIARELGLLHRSQNDFKAVVELSNNLKLLDPKDPSRYDFALFGLGVNKKPEFNIGLRQP